MADYKAMFTETLNSIIGKVKDVAENVDVKDSIEKGTNKVKAAGQVAKLSLELTADNAQLNKVYAQIGKLYYEMTQETGDEALAPLFLQAQQITQVISDKEALIAALKAADCEEDCCCGAEDCCCECADVEVEVCEFEDVVEAVEEAAEAVEEVVEEAVEEAKEAVEEIVEEIKD